MNLLKDLWDHIKEWSDWKMKDWIKAAIVAIVVLWIISWMTGGAAQTMVWQLLAKPLLGVATDAVRGFVETKKLKGEVKIAQIKAEKKKQEDIAAGKIKWEAAAVDQMKGSWKDELILICLLAPAIAVFVPGWTPHIKAGFEALHSLPDYYKHLLYLACSVSFGVKAGPAAMSLFKRGK